MLYFFLDHYYLLYHFTLSSAFLNPPLFMKQFHCVQNRLQKKGIAAIVNEPRKIHLKGGVKES